MIDRNIIVVHQLCFISNLTEHSYMFGLTRSHLQTVTLKH